MVEVEEVPGVDLARALTTLDPATLDFEERLAAIGGWEQIISWAHAQQHDLLAAVDRDVEECETGWNAAPAARWRSEQLGLMLGISGASAAHRVTTAVTLVENLPQLHEALRTGRITVQHARVAATHATHLDQQIARTVDAAVVADQDWTTPHQLERTVARAVIEVDPDGAAARARAAQRRRRVSLRDEPDGMTSLWALLPAPQGQLVHKTLDAHARSSAATNTPGDHRTLDERRADALVELVIRRMSDNDTADTDSETDSAETDTDTADHADPANAGEASTEPAKADPAGTGSPTTDPVSTVSTGEPTLHGHRPQIHVTIPWSTLIGLDDLPADLTGYGPIDAATARRIAADPTAVWRRLIVDPITGRWP